jgi:xanthine/uracil/vitamin C permease (AzgA family)
MVKYRAMDDRGSLAMAADQIQFMGRKSYISVSKVAAVSLVPQQIPWPAHAVMTLLAIPLGLVLLHWYVAVTAALIIAIDVLGLLIAISTKWVRVDYQDESGARRTACFADGSMFGWGGLLGGTSELYRAIASHSGVASAGPAK